MNSINKLFHIKSVFTTLFIVYSENFEGTERPVVPVVPGLVPVDVGKTAVVRVTAVQTAGTVLKFACSHQKSPEIEVSLRIVALSPVIRIPRIVYQAAPPAAYFRFYFIKFKFFEQSKKP